MKTFNKLLLSVACLLVFSVSVSAQTADSEIKTGSNAFYGSKTYISLKQDLTKVTYKKSETKAAALSAVLPGLGQVYNGSWKRSLIYFGIEAVGWYVYFNARKKGSDIEDEYEAYADEHWDEEQYRLDNANSPDTGTHTLPDTHTQQYYEMIGKYNQFVQWWDDYDGTNSGHRLYYMDVRYDSNQQFDKSHKMVMMLFASRFVSVLDAFFTARALNNRGIKSSAKLMDFGTGEKVPAISLTKAW